jgi:hypothetical protein
VRKDKGILISYFKSGRQWGTPVLDIYLCDVCYEVKEGPMLSCQDIIYCTDCNKKYFKTQLEANKVPLVCLGSYLDEEKRTYCRKELSE